MAWLFHISVAKLGDKSDLENDRRSQRHRKISRSCFVIVEKAGFDLVREDRSNSTPICRRGLYRGMGDDSFLARFGNKKGSPHGKDA